MMTRVIPLITALAVVLGACAWAEEPPENPMEAALTAACLDIEEGRPAEAASSLLRIMRTAPADSSAEALSFMEAVYLLAFDVSFLLDWPQRMDLVAEFSTPPVEAGDDVLMTIASAAGKLAIGASGKDVQAAVDTMKQVADGPNKTLACGTLFYLSSPHYFGMWDHREETIRRLLVEHPESGLGQHAVRVTVYNNIQKAVEAGTGLTPLLRGTNFGEKDRGALSQADPVLGLSLAKLDTLVAGEIKPDVISDWINMLAQPGDDNQRTHFFWLLRPYRNNTETRGMLEPVLRALAEEAEMSACREMAREAMLDYAMIDGNHDGVTYWANRILEPGRIPASPQVSLIESHLKKIKGAATMLADAKRFGDAIELNQKLAAKYPNSVVASDCADSIAAIEAKMAAQ